jgi:DNA-binding MarR family transcriptional regulator
MDRNKKAYPSLKKQSKSEALAEQLLLDLGLIRRAMRRPLQQQIAEGGLTAPQQAAMQVVVRHEGISLKDLSHAMGLAHSTVSGIADRLERRGLIERKPDADDGRITNIHATAVVSEFIREQIPQLQRGPLVDALERAPDREREQIAAAIRRLRELLEAGDCEVHRQEQ